MALPEWEQEARTLLAGNPTPPPPPVPDPPVPDPGPNPAPDPKGRPRTAPKTYLMEMPSVARVTQVIRGTTTTDTVSRQMGAFTWLQDILYTMNGMDSSQRNINRLAADEQRLLRQYTTARANLDQQPHNADSYSQDTTFRNEVVRLLFSPQSEVYRANYDPNIVFDPRSDPTTDSDGLLPFGLSLVSVATPILLLAGAGGALVVYRRRSTRLRESPIYKDVQIPPRTMQPPEPAPAPVRPVTSAVPKTGRYRDQLFAEQKKKFQMRYNDAVDEVTAVTVELTQLAPVVKDIQNNLRLLSKAVYSRVQALITEKAGGTGKVLRNALLWAPVYRLFRRARLIAKILIIVVAWFFIVLPAIRSLEAGEYIPVVVIYALAAAAFFYFERRRQLKLPLNLLKNNAGTFKSVALSYVYDNQAPYLVNDAAAYDSIRVSTDTPEPEVDGTLPCERSPIDTLFERRFQLLPESAEFIVLLFSDKVVEPPMQKNWIPKRQDTIQPIVHWFNGISANGGTNAWPAFKRAFGFSSAPDAIYFMTDGDLSGLKPDDLVRLRNSGSGSAFQRFMSILFAAQSEQPERSTVINTIAIDESPSETLLRQIAADSGGTYRLVTSSK